MIDEEIDKILDETGLRGYAFFKDGSIVSPNTEGSNKVLVSECTSIRSDIKSLIKRVIEEAKPSRKTENVILGNIYIAQGFNQAIDQLEENLNNLLK